MRLMLVSFVTASSLQRDLFLYFMFPLQIFAREQASIVDADSYAAVIRYNHFQTDPLGTQVSRSDL
jgi:hypothetical protein